VAVGVFEQRAGWAEQRPVKVEIQRAHVGHDRVWQSAGRVARTVLINAGPWLPVPPTGYGGIENVLATLIPELRRRGLRVWLCAVAGSEIEVDRRFETFAAPMFEHIAGPYNQMMGIAHAQMSQVLRVLREHGDAIDLVHDHLEVVGPSVLGALAEDAPPVLQTLHWDLGKHPDFYGSFDGRGRVFFNGVSRAQLRRAPQRLQDQALGAIPLATPVEQLPFADTKDGPFLVLARITPVKGQDIAARLCRARGWPCDLAGPVAGLSDRAALEAALAEPGGSVAANADAQYFLDQVSPLLGSGVRWVGALSGRPKLCPITWEEPGATNVVEALACGTPVIGMRRGALPELIEHGITGFLADTEDEFASYCARADEIDPGVCRAAAEERFTAAAMADAYVTLYEEAIRRTDRRARPG
jgi:glycosyltransferase involved in cell wall biosynthesis